MLPMQTDSTQISSIANADIFLPVIEKETNKRYYGGDQAWYSEKMAKEAGCGTIAAANLMAYMGQKGGKREALYGYEDYSKEHFLAHMEEVYQYLKPWYVPVVRRPLGIWSWHVFLHGVKRFAKSRGVTVTGKAIGRWKSRENIILYIRTALQENKPIAMLIGKNNRMVHIRVTQPNGKHWIQSSFQTHWVTVTKMTVSQERVTLQVSSWGGIADLDLDDWIKGEQFYRCMIYIQ